MYATKLLKIFIFVSEGHLSRLVEPVLSWRIMLTWIEVSTEIEQANDNSD